MRGHDYYARARTEALIHTLAIAVAALAGALAFPLAARASTSSVTVGATAPDFTLKALDGRNLRLSEYRGDVVVLTFWASWCGACRPALEEANAFVATQGKDGAVVLGINIDGDVARARSVADSLSLKYPTLVDARQAVGRLYDIDALPFTLVVDRDGIVRGEWSDEVAPKADLAKTVAGAGQ
jgi:peroxiredoxin